uniref:Uncharacterized protein n=1 Tax=Oryza brachyantha TaxID=4533 RepID=J3M1V1_ORYBR
MPSRGSAACLFTRNPTFSASVSLPSRSAARAAALFDRSQNPYPATVAFDASHANTGVCALATLPPHNTATATTTAKTPLAAAAAAIAMPVDNLSPLLLPSSCHCRYIDRRGERWLLRVCVRAAGEGAARDRDAAARRELKSLSFLLALQRPLPCTPLCFILCVCFLPSP